MYILIFKYTYTMYIHVFTLEKERDLPLIFFLECEVQAKSENHEEAVKLVKESLVLAGELGDTREQANSLLFTSFEPLLTTFKSIFKGKLTSKAMKSLGFSCVSKAKCLAQLCRMHLLARECALFDSAI